MQTKRRSLIEAAVTTGVAILLSLLSYQLLAPYIGVVVTFQSNVYLTLYFTGLSFLRTYILRRLFNRAEIRREMPTVRPRVGSIQSLPRSGGVPYLFEREHEDTDAESTGTTDRE